MIKYGLSGPYAGMGVVWKGLPQNATNTTPAGPTTKDGGMRSQLQCL